MLKVLKDPSLLAAAPGTPARAAMMDAPQPQGRGTGMPATASPGTGDPGESLGLPIRSPVPERSSPSLLESSGPSGDLRAEPSAAPRALISSSPGDRTQDWLEAPTGLLSSRGDNPPPAGTNPQSPGTSAAGAVRVMENGGLFSSQVAIEFSSMNDARAAGQSPAPGTDLLGLPGGPALLPGAYIGLVAPPEKPVPSFNRFYAYGLAFLALSVAPFAAGFLRRRLI